MRHLRWSVRNLFNTDARSVRLQNNSLCRVIDNDDLRVISFGNNLKDTVLKVFVVDRPIIDESDVGALGFQFANEREREDAESHAAEAGRRPRISYLPERNIDKEPATGRELTGDKAEQSFYDSKRQGIRRSFYGAIVQHHVSAGVKMKRRSVHEHDRNQTVIAGLDNIAFINGFANTGLGHYQVTTGDGDRPGYDPQFADGRRARLPTGAKPIAILFSGLAARHPALPLPSGVAPPAPLGWQVRDVRISRSFRSIFVGAAAPKVLNMLAAFLRLL